MMTSQNILLTITLICTSLTLNLIVMKKHNKEKVKTLHIVESLLLTIGLTSFHFIYFN